MSEINIILVNLLIFRSYFDRIKLIFSDCQFSPVFPDQNDFREKSVLPLKRLATHLLRLWWQCVYIYYYIYFGRYIVTTKIQANRNI